TTSMATKTVLFTLITSLVLLYVSCLCSSQANFSGQCAFYFGGSTFDVGTNNYLNMSIARADFPHNGIDFPAGPTGRFSNGRNVADYIAMKMGLNFSPPAYLSLVAGTSGTNTSDLQIVVNNGGLNYASIGGGISDYGSRFYVQVVPIGAQVSQMESVARDLQTVFNSTAAAAYLSPCTYYINVGSGSLAQQLDNLIFTDRSYIDRLISEFVSVVQALYATGARKFGVVGPQQIGCSPLARSLSPTGRCQARVNLIAAAIPSRLIEAMSMLRDTNQDIIYSVADTYIINSDITNSPTLYADFSGPCAFYFGGATFDVGTNNYLNMSTARADFPQNGIDFPAGPTGRFSNGRNVADYIAMKTGLNFSPPAYLSFVDGTSGTDTSDLQSVINNGGLNFASAGDGFSDFGRMNYGQVVPIGTQVTQMEGLARDLQTVFNSTAAATYLRNCVYYIDVGGSDIVVQLDNLVFTDPSFIGRVTSQFVSLVQALYSIGARKFGIVGPQQIGCSPIARARSPTGRCRPRANSIAAAIPSQLAIAMRMLRVTNQDIIYSVANTYNINSDITNSPTLYGIRNVTGACCGDGTTLCVPNSTVCRNRDGYLYWNPAQLTESGSRLVVEAFFSDNSRYTDPISFTELISAPNSTE
ncbi:GDSL esterase/lipase At5g55050, partial [Linum grandiflorum]